MLIAVTGYIYASDLFHADCITRVEQTFRSAVSQLKIGFSR